MTSDLSEMSSGLIVGAVFSYEPRVGFWRRCWNSWRSKLGYKVKPTLWRITAVSSNEMTVEN